MTENQFDEFFRKKLGDYSSPVPEDMWQRVKPKKDRDRRILLLLLLAGLIAGGAGTYFIFSSRENVHAKEFVSSKKNSINSTENKPVNQNNKNESIITQGTINQKTENKNSSVDEARDEKEYNLNTSSNTTVKNNNSVSNQIIGKENVQENNSSENIQQAQSSNIGSNQEEKKVSASSKNETPDKRIADNDVQLNQNSEKNSTLKKDSSLKSILTNTQTSKKERVERSPIINNLFLEMFVSPDVPVSKTSSSNSNYLRYKDSTSNMQLSYTVGLRVGALFGEHFTLKTGFQYSRVNEKFNYLNNNATRTIPVTIRRTVTDANGNARTFLDTSELMQVGKNYKLTYNQYKSFDIPILVGYQTAGDRFKAAFNTGVILNVKTNYKGETLDSSLNPVDINSINAYKNKTGVSLYLGLGLSTKLNGNLQLFTEPYIKYHLSNMTGPYQPFSQKINVGGLSLGLRYNF
jgi:opacity protein-like surface antigen